ncbi:MAG: heparan N-sulfatase, partial [Planctomycetota bacterium]|nr:heparan N-sulfatase [Planctomycetota bacterium]
QLAVAKRPAEELFNIRRDPGCLKDLAENPDFANVKHALAKRLDDYLRVTQDPRVVDPDGGNVFENYPRYSGLRWFPEPDWHKSNPGRAGQQPWLEKQRPKAMPRPSK